MRVLCVIPSRIGSTRLARKPLAMIRNKPMVQHVYENALQCPDIDGVVVATDSEEIAQRIQQLGGEARLTPVDCASGSDRVALIAEQFQDMDIVINCQGDQPFVSSLMLQQLIEPYRQGQMPHMSTLACQLPSPNALDDPHIVKVVTDQQGYALYFSRAPIPFQRQAGPVPVFQHIGLYAFQRDFLLKYTHLPQTPLEKAESLEQLRVLEHGYRIQVRLTSQRPFEVNTPEELAAAQQIE